MRGRGKGRGDVTGASWRRVVSVWPKMLGAGCVAFMLAVGLAACTRGAGVHIDYLNFVRFGGIEYVTPYTVVVRAPTADNLGPVYGKVGFKLDGNVDDSNYQPKDGDASYLDVGTPVYTVRGYAPTFRLAAQFAGRLTFYEANSNPKAKTGADLLDIGGKGRSIDVNSEYDGKTQLATISDPAQVARLVALVLAAPVDQQRQESAAASYFIAFHLIHGTAVARNYWAGSGQIVPGILTPPDFRAAVEQAVQRR